jgi:threonine dehydratase
VLRQHPGPIDAIFIPIGGGGLAAGVSAYVKQLRPEIRLIGVQTIDSDAMARSLKAGRRIELSEVGLFSDGTAVKQVGVETFRLCQACLDDVILVDTDEICAAIKDVFQDTRSILEPAGALAVAGAKAWLEREAPTHGGSAPTGLTLVALTCGANMNFDRLRFVSERAEIGEQREAVFAVTIPEERGSFRRFCELIGPRNVTEFNYRIADARVAHVFVGLQVANRDQARETARNFEANGFAALDLSDDELAKSHVRHLVGGHSPLARDELLYRFEFPERPGALMRFLTSMSPNWNISLFHYRNHGADYGRILVGLQVPGADKAAFDAFLSGLGYRYWDESRHPAYRLFLAAGGESDRS